MPEYRQRSFAALFLSKILPSPRERWREDIDFVSDHIRRDIGLDVKLKSSRSDLCDEASGVKTY
jgi:hypothetical protein